MPRPINLNDIKKWKRGHYQKYEYHHHSKIGWWIKYHETYYGDKVYSYSLDRHGVPIRCTFKTIQKRMKTGRPPKRRMKDIAIFSMGEIEEAQRIMEEMHSEI